MDNLIRFRRDTKFRQDMFTADSFSHPAKLDAQLLIWLVEKFTVPGETILDPMFGSGTLMLACTMGRHVIGVELEEKYVDMAKKNWEKVRQRPQLGYEMGTCRIFQGDARNLSGLLADSIITSPPYGELANEKKNTKSNVSREERLKRAGYDPKSYMGGIARNTSIEDGLRYSHDSNNIGNLPYGDIDSIITSPPYADALQGKVTDGLKDAQRLEELTKQNPNRKWKRKTELTPGRMRAWGVMGTEYSPDKDNIGSLPYGSIDSVITSKQVEANSDMVSTYVLLFQMNNPVTALLEISVSANVLSSLFGTRVPEITIGFQDSLLKRNQEINKISATLELPSKLNTLLGQLLGDNLFKVREPSFAVTFKRAEDAPVTCQSVRLDTKGLTTKSALAVYLSSSALIEALSRTETFLSIGDLLSLGIIRFPTNGAGKDLSLLTDNGLASVRAVFPTITGHLTSPSSKGLPADKTIPSNSSTHLSTVSIIPQISAIVTSPPYEASLNDQRTADDRMAQLKRNVNPDNTGRETKRVMKKGFSPHEMNVQGYSVDHIVTSPPYEASVTGDDGIDWSKATRGKKENWKPRDRTKESSYGKRAGYGQPFNYSGFEDNIGNLKGESYLSSMFQVYLQCHAVLRPGGLMILVVKSFIRDQKIIDLAADTMKLCERAGFTFQERWYRELPAQSFWRIIYKRKYPDAPELKFEDVLVFEKLAVKRIEATQSPLGGT